MAGSHVSVSASALEACPETDADAVALADVRVDADLGSLMATIAPARDDAEGLPLKCCCGSAECVFLRHSNSILDSVEKDVHTAARMGQVRLPFPFHPTTQYVRIISEGASAIAVCLKYTGVSRGSLLCPGALLEAVVIMGASTSEHDTNARVPPALVSVPGCDFAFAFPFAFPSRVSILYWCTLHPCRHS
ncbi:hypothetical protein TruAng_005890 [Truncatella angustata]|nr:hypothetical protein TruAng_005890 [Truncatella angustata]